MTCAPQAELSTQSDLAQHSANELAMVGGASYIKVGGFVGALWSVGSRMLGKGSGC